MTDYFALLGEPRRPWLDPESLKEKFHKLSAAHHPDVAKTNDVDFSAINAAYTTLLDPRSRIRHLLELEFPDAPAGDFPSPPPDILKIFETVASERREVTDFLKKRASLQSPLEIALLAPKKLKMQDVLDGLQNTLVQRQEGFLTHLKFLDALWDGDRASLLNPLLEIHHGLSFMGKWLAQVQEDLMRLKEY
jgi:curved DNA-binding protein CbpA